MSKRLFDHLTADYVSAANRLKPQGGRRKIVAYVESYDDVFFWRALLGELETKDRYFEVMLPSRTTLGKGKKVALMNALKKGLGEDLIVCVDADYDYLLQGTTEISKILCESPWVFHTIAYAIESYQCYAPSLHTVCVMATLNDRKIFDFEAFLSEFSKIVFPLFAWSIWCYRYGKHNRFTMQDLCNVVHVDGISLYKPERMLEAIRKKVNSKIGWLQRNFPEARQHYKDVVADIQRLGVSPELTYMFMRGHDLQEKVVAPLLDAVCRTLTRERENEIKRLACHNTQMRNELSGYEHASSSVEEMLRKHTEYKRSPLYQRIIADVRESYSPKPAIAESPLS